MDMGACSVCFVFMRLFYVCLLKSEIKADENRCLALFISGIKHVFLYINICWTQRVMLKPEPERRAF